ncbi:PREDICTED: tetraspanin-33-like [Priapulus caudatus]|uniref:Tetraspanin n=1 Tax=Priapulus caudatus TaxID=37621 RepID=A0ABM1DNG0_PRICU|nr:PREDICTED: tetraspanin-33-like [Priapulus caudatus]
MEDVGQRNITFSDYLLDLSVICMVLGAIIFCLAFCGCLGALRENTVFLKIFYYLLMTVFLLEVALAVLSFVFYNKIREQAGILLPEELISRYRETDDDFQSLIDGVQVQFKCCGVSEKSYQDWSYNRYFNCSDDNLSVEACGVPYSCCRDPRNPNTGLPNTMCGYHIQDKSFGEVHRRVYTTGCIDAIIDVVHDNMITIASVAIGIAVVQLIGLYLARSLTVQIEDQKARWNYPQ